MAATSYTPVPIPAFGAGLNLRDKADTVSTGEAIDLLNVDFGERGSVRQRDGYATFTAVTTTNQPDSIAAFYTSGGSKQLMIGNGNKLTAVDNTGTVVASSTAPTASPHYFTRFGGPTAEVLYCANGTDNVRSWDGTAFAAPSYTGTAPTGRFLAVTSWDNRLVNARRSGTTAGDSPSSIRFSDPGVPTTFGANNYVDLTPGDGEAIMGVVSWRELLFVFKESKYFVFYDTSTDNTGQPVFKYRSVVTGTGLVASRAVCAAREAVYFMDRKGIYRTTGGAPELVSDIITPFFLGGSEQWYLGGELSGTYYTNSAMCFYNERIYVAVTTGSATTNNRMLVHDPRYGWWSLYDIAASCVTAFRPGVLEELVFGYPATSKNVGRHSTSYASDAGVAIGSRWRAGWLDFGQPVEKTVREMKLWGNGVVTCQLSADYGSPVAGEAVTFAGTSLTTWDTGNWDAGNWAVAQAVLGEKLTRKAIRGTVLSVTFSNSPLNQRWSVHRGSFHVREQLAPSESRT